MVLISLPPPTRFISFSLHRCGFTFIFKTNNRYAFNKLFLFLYLNKIFQLILFKLISIFLFATSLILVLLDDDITSFCFLKFPTNLAIPSIPVTLFHGCVTLIHSHLLVSSFFVESIHFTLINEPEHKWFRLRKQTDQ